jgi:hypothetical protein
MNEDFDPDFNEEFQYPTEEEIQKLFLREGLDNLAQMFKDIKPVFMQVSQEQMQLLLMTPASQSIH